jgi:hypothetical protein
MITKKQDINQWKRSRGFERTCTCLETVNCLCISLVLALLFQKGFHL